MRESSRAPAADHCMTHPEIAALHRIAVTVRPENSAAPGYLIGILDVEALTAVAGGHAVEGLKAVGLFHKETIPTIFAPDPFRPTVGGKIQPYTVVGVAHFEMPQRNTHCLVQVDT